MECKVKAVQGWGGEKRFIGEIVNTRVDEGILDDEGRVDFGKMRPTIYDSTRRIYRTVGEVVGSVWDADKALLWDGLVVQSCLHGFDAGSSRREVFLTKPRLHAISEILQGLPEGPMDLAGLLREEDPLAAPVALVGLSPHVAFCLKRPYGPRCDGLVHAHEIGQLLLGHAITAIELCHEGLLASRKPERAHDLGHMQRHASSQSRYVEADVPLHPKPPVIVGRTGLYRPCRFVTGYFSSI